MTHRKSNTDLLGVSFLVLAILLFSLQNMVVKVIGGGYSVLEIVTFRSLVAVPSTLLLHRLEGKRGRPATQYLRLEVVRGVCLFLSYTAHFMGLAALPLADVESLRFSAPLMITALAAMALGERVELQRWLALAVGLGGVLLIVQPGAATFNMGSVFVLLSVFFYALSVLATRKLHAADSSATMAYHSSLVYLVAGLALAPLALWVGEPAGVHPSIAFLFRPWVVPTLSDGAMMAGLGLIWAGGMYCMARAYGLALASVAAPFEYVSLPINALWGLLFWHEIPTWTTIAGAALALSSGLYVLYREHKSGRQQATDSHGGRRGAAGGQSVAPDSNPVGATDGSVHTEEGIS